jgi:hypothetical protein
MLVGLVAVPTAGAQGGPGGGGGRGGNGGGGGGGGGRSSKCVVTSFDPTTSVTTVICTTVRA